MTYDDKFDYAILKLKEMSDHLSTRVSYTEAKFLHGLLPEIIGVLHLGKQFGIDKLTNEEDIESHREFIDLVNKVVGKDADE